MNKVIRRRMSVVMAALLALVILSLCGCDRLPFLNKGIRLRSSFLNNKKRILIFSCSVKEEVSWEEMEEYAKSKQYRYKGITLVLFFDSPENTPDVKKVAFDWSYRQYGRHLVAAYYMNREGQEEFLEAPVAKNQLPYDEYATGGI